MNKIAQFEADVPDDGHYSVVLTKTGMDTATVDLRKWPPNADLTQSAESDAQYAMTGIKVAGNKLTCVVKEWFITDTVVLELSPAVDPPKGGLQVNSPIHAQLTKGLPDTFLAAKPLDPAPKALEPVGPSVSITVTGFEGFSKIFPITSTTYSQVEDFLAAF